MQVTRVEVTIPHTQGKRHRGWAKIVLDEVLLITGIKLFENNDNGKLERYIRFPDKQLSLHSTGGQYFSIPVVNTDNDELRNHITEKVFEEYDKKPKNPSWKKKEYRD